MPKIQLHRKQLPRCAAVLAASLSVGTLAAQPSVGLPYSSTPTTTTTSPATPAATSTETSTPSPTPTSSTTTKKPTRPKPTTAKPTTTTTPTSTTTTPAVPVPTLPVTPLGYVETFRDDFAGTEVDKTKWGIYRGGGKLNAHPDNVKVSDGYLNLLTTKVQGEWRGSGVSNARAFHQTYGRFEIRARLDPAFGTRGVGLLWPHGGGWPPEVDFFEIGGGTPLRDSNMITNHFNKTNDMEHLRVKADYTKWHVIGIEWAPGSLISYLDGVPMGGFTGSSVPKQDLWLGLQTNTGHLEENKPNATTPAVVKFQVDWVAAYAKKASSTTAAPSSPSPTTPPATPTTPAPPLATRP